MRRKENKKKRKPRNTTLTVPPSAGQRADAVKVDIRGKPRFRQSLFWDVDPKTIDPKRHARYIIERVLDFGNDREVRWMWHFYRPSLVRKVLQTSRVLHEKSKSLWTLLYQ